MTSTKKNNGMKTWKEYLDERRDAWIGRRVRFSGEEYTVVAIDANGALMIDRPTQYNETTAIDETMIDR